MASINTCQKLSHGIKAVMDKTQTFAHVQALWRFLSNDKVDLPTLSEPVLSKAKEDVPLACDEFVLAVHDWSRLNYARHTSKHDKLQMTHEKDVGYELQSSILVSDRDGLPVAVPMQNLVTVNGVWHSQKAEIQGAMPHLDELTERIRQLEEEDFGKRLVHIVDREADSVGHLRQWKDWNFIVRVKAGSTVRSGDKTQKIAEVAGGLSYTEERQVLYEGKRAVQWVAQTQVVLARKAKPKAKDEHGKRLNPIAGQPLPVRLIVSRVCNAQGVVLAEWFLLSNLPQEVPAEGIALWYYYRWSIESFFKLLKEAGCQLESWGQETGLGIAKRLLIAAQACAVVWRLIREEGQEAQELRAFLVRLSGRQMKRTRPITPTALMDGFFKFLTLLETFQSYSKSEIEQFAKTLFPDKQWKFV